MLYDVEIAKANKNNIGRCTSPLISILVLTYNNSKYIYALLDSILCQTYDNIQLIISDDASEIFPLDDVRNYVLDHSNGNINSCVININEKNIKTVAHVEKLLNICTGDYITIIAADDAYYSVDVISSLHQPFREDPSLQVVMGQTIMCDCTLKKEMYDFTKPNEIRLVNTADYVQLFYELSCRIFLPAAGVMFKRDILNKIGGLSPTYTLVEDWTTHLRLVRYKAKMLFIDMPAIRHRDGGVSHGNSNGSQGLNLTVWEDILKATEHEIFPYMYQLSEEQCQNIRKIYAGRVFALERDKKKIENINSCSDQAVIPLGVERMAQNKRSYVYVALKKWDGLLHRVLYKVSNITIPMSICKCILILSPIACIKKVRHFGRNNSRIKRLIEKLKGGMKKYRSRYASIQEYNNIQKGYFNKIENLKRTIDGETKIKVAFIVVFDSTFPSAAVFENMMSGNQFDPYIIVTPDLSRGEKHLFEVYNRAFENLYKSYGNRVLHGYDTSSKTYMELKDEYKIVFFSNPYKTMVHPHHYIDYFLDKNVLTAYIDYGFPAVKYAREVFNTDFYNKVWRVFTDSYITKRELFLYQPIRGRNSMVTGYAKMDKLYTASIDTNKKRKRIIICPHHTVLNWKPLDISNFEKYAELFISLPKDFPEVDFIFRPHPLLFTNMLNSKKWSPNDLDDYMCRLLSSSNMTYDQSGDYFSVFKNSDGMIHDCSSFIGEYLFTEKPCCYMLKDKNQLWQTYSRLGQKCLNNYYLAFSKDDIYHFIQYVILKDEDPMRIKRVRFAENVLKRHYPHSAEAINMFLCNQLNVN